MENNRVSTEQETPVPPLALGVAIVAGIMAAALRIVPHPPNFSGVGGLGIFGGARLRAWQALLLQLAVLIGSDCFLWALTGFDSMYSPAHFSRVYVYASFMIYVAIGRWLCNRNSLPSITLSATLGAVQFFVLTNFCSWLFQPWEAGYELIPAPFRYTRDLSGLANCFTFALPFYQDDVPYVNHPFMLFTDFRLSLTWIYLGDLIFSTACFLAYARLGQRRVSAEPAPVPLGNN